MDEYQLNLRRFYIELRDKNVEQLMNINGKAAFASLALLASITAGYIKENFVPAMNSAQIFFGYLLVFLGVISLLVAVAFYSKFYTFRIRELEKLIKKPVSPDEVNETLFVIFPSGKNYGFVNYMVFLGICAVCLGVLTLMF